MSKNPKNWGKLMKVANIDREFFHIFWTTQGNSMKVSGKMCFKIILGHKKPGFHLLSRRYIFQETTGVGASNWPPSGRLGLSRGLVFLGYIFLHPSHFHGWAVLLRKGFCYLVATSVPNHQCTILELSISVLLNLHLSPSIHFHMSSFYRYL